MSLTAGKIKGLKKPVTFDYMGESVHIEYHPASINGASLAQIQDVYRRMEAARNDAETTEADAESLMLEVGAWVAAALAGWDYLEDDPELGEVGQPTPITPERIVFELKRFPDFITACIAEIGKDYNQGKAQGAPSSKNSVATSSPKGRSALRKASRNRSA